MTSPNPAREHHATLKVLEDIAATKEALIAVAPGPAAPPPVTTDAVWLETKLGDEDVVMATVEIDDGSAVVTLPLWTSFAVQHPRDPEAVLAPMLEPEEP